MKPHKCPSYRRILRIGPPSFLALTATITMLLWLPRPPAATAGSLTQYFTIAIGDSVSNGMPAPGAGNLEAPGAVDIYTFSAAAGQEIVFDWLSGSNGLIGWQLAAPDQALLFDSVLADYQLTLPQTGVYTLTVSGNNPSATGLYGFRLLAVAAPQQFAIAIGDTVSNGVPAPGAGNLEAPGAVDVYTFAAAAGQGAIFDWLSGSNGFIGWQLAAPDQAVLFDSVLADYQLTLPQTGVYTLIVSGNNPGATGLYGFRLLAVAAPQQFAIAIGDTVSDGVPAPGAGNLEAPGAVDVYPFSAAAGQEIVFDWLSGSNALIGWQLAAPDQAVLFDSVLTDYQLTLSQTGVYTLTVSGNNPGATGLYGFRLLAVAAPQQFAVAIGDTVSDGVPAPGAGNLEVPGAVDVYTFDGLDGQEVLFDWLSGSNVLLGWALAAPDGSPLFDQPLQDLQLILPQSGTYSLTVDGNDVDNFGIYAFRLQMIPPAPQQFAVAIGDTVSDGIPAPGAGNLEVPGAVDVYTFDGLGGQEVLFDWLSGSNVLLGWALAAPDGSLLFDQPFQDLQLILPQSGTYSLTVDGNGLDDFGIYSFALREEVVDSWTLYLPAIPAAAPARQGDAQRP